MSERPRILCLGRILLDAVATPLNALPSRFTTQPVDNVVLLPGGSGANTSLALARLGRNVTLAGKVGEDWQGDVLAQRLESLGVTCALKSDDKQSTAVNVVAVNSHGDAKYVVSDGADLTLGLPTNWEFNDPFDYVHVGNFNYFAREEGEPLLSWLQHMRDTNEQLVVTADATKSLQYSEYVSLVASEIDYFIGNFFESRHAAGQLPTLNGIAIQLGDYGVRRGVVIKMGSLGAYWWTRNDGGNHEPAFWVDAVNENGAGDLFSAAVVHGLAAGRPLGECIRDANRLGAWHVSLPTGILTSNETWEKHRDKQFEKDHPRSGAIPLDSPPLEYNSRRQPLSPTRFNETRRIEGDNLLRWIGDIEEFGRVTNETNLLDAGCGTGRFAIHIKRCLRCNVTGVDSEAAMLDEAKDYKNTDIRWLECDLTRLDDVLGGEAGTFHCVWMSSVLQLVDADDWTTLFEQIRLMLTDRGRLLIRTSAPELVDKIAFYRFFPAGKSWLKDKMPQINTLWSLLLKSGFMPTDVKFRNDETEMPPDELIRRLESRGFSWCEECYSEKQYARCLEKLKNELAGLERVYFHQPAYLIVAEKC